MDYFNYGTAPVYIEDDDNISEALLMDCLEDVQDPFRPIIDDKKMEEIKIQKADETKKRIVKELQKKADKLKDEKQECDKFIAKKNFRLSTKTLFLTYP